MTHKGTVVLETERLVLRRFSPDDSAAMYNNMHTRLAILLKPCAIFSAKIGLNRIPRLVRINGLLY